MQLHEQQVFSVVQRRGKYRGMIMDDAPVFLHFLSLSVCVAVFFHRGQNNKFFLKKINQEETR
jgi:uncharacterized protein (DUF952 family)